MHLPLSKFAKVIIWVFILAPQATIWADIAVIREVTINPHTSRAFSNLSDTPLSNTPLPDNPIYHQSSDYKSSVEMQEAEVDITVDTPNPKTNHVLVHVSATFNMKNTSKDTLALSVAFPIASSRDISLCSLTITPNPRSEYTEGTVKDTGTQVFFNGARPLTPEENAEFPPIYNQKRMRYKITDPEKDSDSTPWIEVSSSSGMDGMDGVEKSPIGGFYNIMDFTAVSNDEKQTVYHRRTGYPNFRKQERISGPDLPPENLPDYFEKPFLTGENYNNKMIWREDFAPNEERIIQVDYSLYLAPLTNEYEKRKMNVGGFNAGPTAENTPSKLLSKIKKDKKYYFFDYFLESGASWKGTIGKEVIRLHLPKDVWEMSDLECYPKKLNDEDGVLVYTLENEDPDYNLYFALPMKE